ncbi:hypothetical protein TNCV_340331 [Trichonephila clavipes]|nr:hypothetical protein TNCV_340331 [Trichonephila clavipes]
MCTNCSSEPATPAHILECPGLTKQDLADVPLLVLDYLNVFVVMWTWSAPPCRVITPRKERVPYSLRNAELIENRVVPYKDASISEQ